MEVWKLIEAEVPKDQDLKGKDPEEIAKKFASRPTGKGGKEPPKKGAKEEAPKKGAKELAPVKGGKKGVARRDSKKDD
jgi:hypothetical protein